jgi:hypothetical protein
VQFISEKGTRISRACFSDIAVGEKIRVPVFNEDQSSSLEGLFSPNIAQIAVEVCDDD